MSQAGAAGNPQPIEALVGQPTSDHYLATLEELVHIELEFRWKERDPLKRPQLEDYLERFEPLANSAILSRLVDQEIKLRLSLGESPTTAEYQQRFPEATVTIPVTDQAAQDTGIKSEDDVATQREMPTIAPGSDTGSDPLDSATIAGPEQQSKRKVILEGDFVPGYDLLGELGRGGMGVVYQARDQKLKRIVALKMILSGVHASEEDMQRFQTEAEAVAKLQHPNIVQIFEVGEHKGNPYISLEYQEGGGLDNKIAGTPQNVEESARLIETLARAMQVAHQQEIIHRDLKPANILLSADGEPKITDFGLAKRMDKDSNQTKSGTVMGTPSYMAPEQASSSNETIGPAADTYALGAILYHMLTGRPPFRAETQLDTLMQVISDEPLPPRRLNNKIPADLETICLKCLQKDIDRRYDSCEQLAEDLRRFQAGEPIAARPVSAIERGWKWARRRPAIAGMIGVSIVAAVALVAGGIVYNGKLVKERNVANAQRQQAVIAQEESEKQTLLAEEARIEADAQRGVATDRATEANKARSQAEEQRQKALEAEIKAKQLLAQAHVDKGASALHEGDTTKALGWFATAQSVDQGNETNNRLSAMRTWNTLNQTPKPIIELATRAVAQANTINGRRLAEWAILNRDTNQALVLYNQQSRFSKDWLRLIDLNPRSTKQAQKNSDDLRFSKFQNFIRSTEWSPDHSRIAVAYEKSQSPLSLFTKKGVYATTVFDVKTATPVFTLDSTTPVSCQYDPTGKYLLTRSHSTGNMLLWNATTGKQASLAAFPPDTKAYRAKFTPDGRRLIFLHEDDLSVNIWDLNKGEVTTVDFNKRRSPFRISCHPDGQLAALTGFDKIHILDLATGSLLENQLFLAADLLKAPDAHSVKTFFSPDGNYLVAHRGQFVQFWRTDSWKPWIREMKFDSKINHVAFSPDGGRFLTCSDDGRVRIWNIQNGRLANAPLNHEGPVIWADFDRDGRHIFTLSNHNTYLRREATFRSWDLATETPPSRAFRHLRTVTDTDFHPNGKQLLTAGEDGRVLIWDVQSAKVQLTIQLDDQVKRAFFADNGKTVITQTSNNPEIVRLWDTLSGKPISPPLVQKDDMSQVELSPDGKQVLTAGDGRLAYLWDVSNGTHGKIFVPSIRATVRNAIPLATFVDHGEHIIIFSGATFFLNKTKTKEIVNGLSPFVVGHSYSHFVAGKSGNLVALVDQAAAVREEDKVQTILVYNMNDGERLATLQQKALVNKLVFSPDEKHILAATSDNRVYTWQIDNGSSPIPPLELSGRINDLNFSSDGRLLVTASATTQGGGAAQVWDLQTGQPITPPLTDPYGEIVTAQFSPDATSILARRSDNPVEVLLYPIVPSGTIENEQILKASQVLSRSNDQLGGTNTNWQQVRTDWPELTSPTLRNVAEWHRGEAYRAKRRGDWQAVSANLGPVIKSTNDWESYAIRAWFNVLAKKHDDAARDIQNAIDRDMPPGRYWYTASMISLLRDDHDQHRKICQIAVQRLLNTSHQQYDTHDAAQCCISVPAALSSYQELLKRTQETVDRNSNPPNWFSLYCHGALLYRANKAKEAKTFLEDSILWDTNIATREKTGSLGKETLEATLKTKPRQLALIRNWLFLAMCNHQLGNKEKARDLYDKCKDFYENNFADKYPTYVFVHHEITLLLHETATLLDVSSEKKTSTKSENK